MTFGEKIQMLRKSCGWSQEQLAEQIHVSRQALSKWENGTAIPDTNNVVQLAKLFGVSTDYLLLDEADTQAIKESERKVDELLLFREKQMKLLGCILIKWTGILGVIVLAILGSFVYYDFEFWSITPLDFWIQRFIGFLDEFNLVWLFCGLIVMAFVGEFRGQRVEAEYKKKTAEPSE